MPRLRCHHLPMRGIILLDASMIAAYPKQNTPWEENVKLCAYVGKAMLQLICNLVSYIISGHS